MVVVAARAPAPAVPSGPGLDEVAARRVDMWWCAGVLAAIAILFALLQLSPGASIPLLFSLTLAYSLNPLVTQLERRGLSRVLGTSAVFAGGAIVLGGALLYVVPVIRDEALKLPAFLGEGTAQLLPRLEALLGMDLPQFVRQRADDVRENLSSVFQRAGPIAAQVLASLAGNTARWFSALLGLSVVPVLLFLFLLDFPQLSAKLLGLVPRPALPLVERRFKQVDDVLSAFVRGQLIVGSILTVIYSVGLTVARIDLAIVIGIIAGFGNMVPYLGTGIGVVLALLGMLLAWQGPWQLAAVAATFVIGQMLEGFVITPRIVGDRVGLSAVVIIVAILAFSELFGFVGILLAVPVSAVLKVVVHVAVERYQRSGLYRGSVRDAS